MEKAKEEKTKEMVVTFALGDGALVKVEEVQPSGERKEVADQDFAKLVGDGEQECLVAALEEAYAAGVRDAIEEERGEEAEAEASPQHRMILWDEAARRQLNRSVRRLILGRALGRLATTRRKAAQPAKKGTRNGARSAPERRTGV
jgi:hypothetical protein